MNILILVDWTFNLSMNPKSIKWQKP